jgi:hypothetical protein
MIGAKHFRGDGSRPDHIATHRQHIEFMRSFRHSSSLAAAEATQAFDLGQVLAICGGLFAAQRAIAIAARPA